MEAIESLDKECSALGGLFQQVVNDMKTGVPQYEDFVNKAAKLHSHLKGTIMVLGAFLDSFQKIADAATNTKGATREIGACLTRIVLRHKSMESKLKALCSSLLDCMVLPLQDKLEDWRKCAVTMDKDHAKEYKKMRSEVKKRSEAVQRAQKKQRKSSNKSNDQLISKALDSSMLELTKNLKMLQETEKVACRKVLTEERARYCTFVASMRPVLEEEASLTTDFQQLEEINKKLIKCTDEPFILPVATEQVINDMKSDGFTFQTPPSSPSSLGSRKSSMCSISSAGSSNNGSPNHTGPKTNGMSHNLKSMNQARLSSVSSQDSGFTSQDTLFLRPASPKRVVMETNGVDGRPHTISSAYEKGPHQRPPLHPYTFSPPESTLTIHECGEQESENITDLNASLNSNHRKPPVPKRIGQLSAGERPIVPNKTMAATMAAVKQQHMSMLQNQQQQNQGQRGLPTFTSNKNDMVVPQPVYMNMNDLKALAAQKAAVQQHQQFSDFPAEDSPELKTPTAEYTMVPEQKAGGDGGSSTSESSLGSSSGYGSQSTVRVPANEVVAENQLQPPNNSHQPTLTAVHDGSHPNNVATLRRAQHHAHKPPPPARRSSSVIDTNQPLGSNSTTPRSSMENLPPPPPHLLHSDDDDMPPPPPPADTPAVIAQRARSVAESVKALQNCGHVPGSPKSLRRAHSMMAGPLPTGQPASRGSTPQKEQIYAPVAHLQQKIHQRQQIQQQHHHLPQQDEYGFGMQFHQSQSQFYHMDGGVPMQSPPEANHNAYGPANHEKLMRDMDAKMRLQGGPSPQHHQQQQPMQLQQQQPPNGFQRSFSTPSTSNSSNLDAQTAMRVRRWIESKTVTNVTECRPFLNAEIQQGMVLRKTTCMNDRSAPKF